MNNIQLEEGLALFDAENYYKAMKILLPLAESGNSLAQARVGFAYQLGLGERKRDVRNAIKWLVTAANQGVGEAAHNLGTLYLTCEPDLPIDKEKSRFWYKRAELLGFVVGMSKSPYKEEP